MAASRLRDRGSEQVDGIGREFTLNPRVNSLFTAILRGGIRMTLAGMNCPAGAAAW